MLLVVLSICLLQLTSGPSIASRCLWDLFYVNNLVRLLNFNLELKLKGFHRSVKSVDANFVFLKLLLFYGCEFYNLY